MSQTQLISGLVLGVFTVALGIFLYRRREKRKEWKQIAVVAGIRVYPVKGCKAIELDSAECTYLGIKDDRHIAIVDANLTPVTQRSHPQIALIKQELCDDGKVVRLTAPGMDLLDIPLEEPSNNVVTDMDDKDKERVEYRLFGLTGDAVFVNSFADQWVSEYLGGSGFRMLRFPTNGNPRRLCMDAKYATFSGPKDAVAFSDKCPYLMISEESLSDLNSRYQGEELPMSRFRPNIIVRECHPFKEDIVEHLRIGTAEFRGLHRCGRCTVTTVDPATGIKDKEEPLKTLRGFRLVSKEEDWRFGNAPVFGKNLGLEKIGVISCGDPVFSLE